MAWSLLTIYVIASQLLMFLLLASGYRLEPEEQANEFLRLNSQPTRLKPSFYAFVFFSAPILLPIVITKSVMHWRTSERQTLRQVEHQALLLTPVHPANISGELELHIEDQNGAALGMGFDLLGDFWLKDEPYNSLARIYLNENGATIAEAGEIFGIPYCEATTIFNNGTFVTTANVKPLVAMKKFASRGHYMIAVPNGDMLEVLQAHQSAVKKLTTLNQIQAVPLANESWKDALRYVNQYHDLIRFELGELKQPPAEFEFPAFLKIDSNDSPSPAPYPPKKFVAPEYESEVSHS